MSAEPLPRMILLDAVGTVIYPHPSVAQVYTAVGRRFGSRVTEAQVTRRFQTTFDKAFRQQPEVMSPHDREAGERFERERWRSVVEQVLSDVPDAGGEPFELLWEHFAQPASWRVFDDAMALIDSLRRRQLPFGIASNFDRRLIPIMFELCGIAAERVFVSSVLGVMKPDVEFYRRVLSEIGRGPREVIMIGDDRDKDFEAARRAGLHACCVRRSERVQESIPASSISVPGQVTSLIALIPWFDKLPSSEDTV